jgi:ankyrin repeat protein
MRQFDTTQQDMGLFVDELQIRGVDMASIDVVTGMSAIHYAVRSGAANVGHDERAAKIVAQLLTQPGVHINTRCKYAMMTPLHYAALYNCPLVIHQLAKTRPLRGVEIQSPCQLDAKINDDHGGTGYHYAVIAGHPEVVRALLDVGADHTITNDSDYTPLMCAQQHYDNGATDKDLATEEELRCVNDLSWFVLMPAVWSSGRVLWGRGMCCPCRATSLRAWLPPSHSFSCGRVSV